MSIFSNLPAKLADVGGRALRAVLLRWGGCVLYRPDWDYRRLLNERTRFNQDPRPVRDKRSATDENELRRDITITTEGLADVLADTARFRGGRILEVGPKYGYHSLWIDRTLEPSELVFCDFASDRTLHDQWKSGLHCPQRWVYGDLRLSRELLDLPPFDMVFFMGVLYHTTYHVPMLSMLNRVTKPGGHMLLESTIDLRPDSSVHVKWPSETGKAKAVPSLDALRVMLAWTGWRNVTRFTDYRPRSTEVVLLCEKTDDIRNTDGDFCEIVRPHRPPAAPPTTSP